MKKNGKYRFSIVIPSYNEENFLSSCLTSLKNQDFKDNFEIIVVDNNSTDNTYLIANRMGVKVISETQPGVCFARQAGSEVAQGEIIISTDADTIFKKNWLSNIDKTFKKDPNIIAVSGPCRYIDGPWWGKSYTYFLFTANYLYSLLFKHPFYISATNVAFYKSYFEGYDLTSMQGGDELHILNNLKKHGKIKFLYNNPSLTSGRRLKQGLTYNFFVTFLFYYLGAYYLNKLFKRQLIGAAPSFRLNRPKTVNPRFSLGLTTIIVTIAIVATAISPVRNFISDNIKETKLRIDAIVRSIS